MFVGRHFPRLELEPEIAAKKSADPEKSLIIVKAHSGEEEVAVVAQAQLLHCHRTLCMRAVVVTTSWLGKQSLSRFIWQALHNSSRRSVVNVFPRRYHHISSGGISLQMDAARILDVSDNGARLRAGQERFT